MKSLVVLPKSPVPADNGGRQRMVELMQSLHERGGIDVVVGQPLDAEEASEIFERFSGARLCSPPEPVAHHARGRWRWLSARALPLGVALLEPDEVRRDARSFAAASEAPYDLVFASGATAMWMFGRTVRGVPVVIDYADVTSVLHTRQYQAIRADGPPRSARAVKDLVRHRAEAVRWDRFERSQGAKANLVTVCSALDRESLGVPGAVVVPNGCGRPSRPAGANRPSEPEGVLVFPGQMTYGPNVDGARWFVHEILPVLRDLVPGVRIEIVGRAAPEVHALNSIEGVEVRGYVDRIDEALSRATAVIVPLRQGSGTRIKIVEAWAHRLPVVSTTVGAEGLGVVDGRDAMVADGAGEFAAACARVLCDAELRRHLVANGRALYEASYDWSQIRADFGARVDEVIAAATRYAGAGRPLIDEVADRRGAPHASPPLGGGA